jgi:hypothetical protein
VHDPNYEANHARLTAAFNLVANRKNWKMPVNKTVAATANREEISEAVVYFTGSVPSFEPLPNGRVRVRARGYYSAIGA